LSRPVTLTRGRSANEADHDAEPVCAGRALELAGKLRFVDAVAIRSENCGVLVITQCALEARTPEVVRVQAAALR